MMSTADCCAKKARTESVPVLETLRVKRLSENAQLPKKGSERAAGFDLCR